MNSPEQVTQYINDILSSDSGPIFQSLQLEGLIAEYLAELEPLLPDHLYQQCAQELILAQTIINRQINN